MWRWIIILTAVASVFGNFYHLGPYASIAPFHKRNPQKYCGPVLSAALSVVCSNSYNTMFKKSLGPEDYTDSEDAESPFPINTRENALSMFSKNYYRSKKGVYDECCLKTCSLPELRTYCATDKYR